MRKILILTTLLLNNIIVAQIDSVNITNSSSFFKKLSNQGSLWVTLNKQYQKETDFTHFIMQFKADKINGVEGVISGINNQNDTVLFWKIIEFTDLSSGNVIFMQRGVWGYATSFSFFPQKNKRICNFDLVYTNGVKEKHRDNHIFLNDSTIITKSEIYDENTKEWIKQPDMKWKKVKK